MPLKDIEKRREYNRKYMRGWYERNKAIHISYVRKRDRKVRVWLKEYKKNLKCEKCDETHPACLEFHHKNPKEKKFEIGRGHKASMRLLTTEIAKCRVLCANCHRKEHWSERNDGTESIESK